MKYSSAIASAITYILSEQKENGAFVSFTADNQQFLNQSITHTPFITSLILSSLHTVPTFNNISGCKQKAAYYLLSQKSEQWSWNYWERNSSEQQKFPYPDDLDDTFCAITALHHYDKSLITGDVLAKIVMQLTTVEKKEGGPYATWLVKKDAPLIWRDIDIAVNSNIAYFLSLQEISLAPLEKFIEKQIKEKNLTSPYYVTPYSVIYFISRFYKGKNSHILREVLLKQQNKKGYWDNPLNTALAVCALLYLNCQQLDIDKAIRYLIRTQKDGHWKAYSFINERITKNNTIYCGSPALTTAFCLEAIAVYTQTFQSSQSEKNKRAISTENEQLYIRIIDTITERIAFFDKSLVRKSELLLDKLLKKDASRQIPLLPLYFLLSCHKEQSKKVKKAFIKQLGIANTYGWIAYTIYDNFFDKEEDDPQVLSLANLALRELTEIFTAILPINKGFHTIFSSMMDTIDKANAWEQIACRFDPQMTPLNKISLPKYGDYSMIADKSLAHCLGPVAVLIAMGYSQHSSEINNLINYFKHFLIVKQLNDDAHDWEEDLLKGQINPANALLIEKWQMKKRKKQTQDMTLLLPELRELYWSEVIPELCVTIFNHIEQARELIRKMKYIADPSYLESFLLPSERAAQKAQKESESMIKFLATYQE